MRMLCIVLQHILWERRFLLSA